MTERSIHTFTQLPQRHGGRRAAVVLALIAYAGLVAALAARSRTGASTATAEKRYVRPSMIALPGQAGERFLMGSELTQEGRNSDETQHWVRLGSRFSMSETEVTRGQYRAVMGGNPSDWSNCYRGKDSESDNSELPLVCVKFSEAADYCNRLTELEFPGNRDLEGRVVKPCYTIQGEEVSWPEGFACRGYRLPTEVEWEYAAKARRWKVYAGTDDPRKVCDFANVPDQSAKEKHEDWVTFDCRDGSVGPSRVRTKQHNGWHLYDMTGGVWEWVWDYYGEYPTGEKTDTGGPSSGSVRVYRGGSWGNYARNARVSYRNWWSPGPRYDSLGFRLSRSLP